MTPLDDFGIFVHDAGGDVWKMTPLDDLGISSENCPVDDSVGRLRRDWTVARAWIGLSPSKRWQTSHRVFVTVVHISLYELIAHFRYWILRYAIHRVVM